MRLTRIAACTLFTFILAGGWSYSQQNKSKQDKDKGRKADKARPEMSRAEYFKKWLDEDVLYIISEEEKKVFKDLQSEEEKEKFIEQFWARRDTDPRTPENEFKEEHYLRIAYANERFASGIPGWKTDRGRIYIMYGKPAEIESHPSGGSYQREYWEGGGTTSTFPFERWRYRHIDGIGDDIEIEFVDRSMSGEYRIAMSPEEKDALLFVPGAGLTTNEEMGLSKKEDRPYFNPGAANSGTAPGYMRAKDQPFERLQQYFNLQRPPSIKFEDLKALVTTNVTYNTLPFSLRTDFIRLSSDKVLVPISVELNNKDLEYKKELGINRGTVNVYGIVVGLSNRIISEFEDVISLEYADDQFDRGKQGRSMYQKVVAVPPGQRVKLDLVLKDLNNSNIGSISRGIAVPKYEGEDLQASTVILANSILPAPTNLDRMEMFVLGDLKVQPNVKAEYVPGQNLIPYLQIYNATIDQTTQKPSLEITYTVKGANNKILEQLQDLAGNSIQFFSGVRVVVIGKVPLTDVAPGKYTLEVKVTDTISSRTLSAETPFRVNEPVAPSTAAASAAQPK
jgi:GWxTD domain-containing protein